MCLCGREGQAVHRKAGLKDLFRGQAPVILAPITYQFANTTCRVSLWFE